MLKNKNEQLKFKINISKINQFKMVSISNEKYKNTPILKAINFTLKLINTNFEFDYSQFKVDILFKNFNIILSQRNSGYSNQRSSLDYIIKIAVSFL